MNKRNILIITVIILVVFLFFTLFQSKNNRRKKKAEKTLLTKKIKQKDNYVKKSGKIEKGKIIIDTLTDNGLSREEAYKMVNEIKPVQSCKNTHGEQI